MNTYHQSSASYYAPAGTCNLVIISKYSKPNNWPEIPEKLTKTKVPTSSRLI